MSKTNVPSGPAPIEMLAEWEGPAQLNPTVFAGPKELEGFLADPGLIGEAAAWIAVTIGSAIVGNSVYDALKAKVLGFLTAWRQRHGQAKLNDLKQKVLEAFQRGKADPEETRRRIDALFAEAEK
jgi:hypothetical protein